MSIHPTAVVGPDVQVGQGVEIGPYCVVDGDVVLGERVRLLSHVAVAGQTSIGADCVIYPFASVGHAPQDLKFQGERSRLEIGARNVIREHVTINPGTEGGGMVTRIGDDSLFMVGAHVAHDCQVGDRVVMANNATLAGHVIIGDGAILGGLCAVHQFARIGKGAMVGGMSGVEHDVIPYGMVMGERAWLQGLNLIGLKRGGVGREAIQALRGAYKTLFVDSDGRTAAERLEEVARGCAGHQVVGELVEFMRADTPRGLVQAKPGDGG